MYKDLISGQFPYGSTGGTCGPKAPQPGLRFLCCGDHSCRPPSSLWATQGLRAPVGQCARHLPASLPFVPPLPPSSPKGVARPAVDANCPGLQKGACHSLGQGHVCRVQQKLLPAVGAHQLHCLLVEAHLPETTPSHAHGAWPQLPEGAAGPRLRAGWGGRQRTLRSPQGGQGWSDAQRGRGTLRPASYPRLR